MIIYTDGSFKTSQQPLNKDSVSYTSAYWFGNEPVIESFTIPRTPTLQSYSNLAEFHAIRLAVEYALDNDENYVLIRTDSKVCVAWIRSVKVGVYMKKKKVSTFSTVQHKEIFDSLVKHKDNINFDIEWIPRERNIIGVILDEFDL